MKPRPIEPPSSCVVHARAIRDDGYVSARCVRHVKTRPTCGQWTNLIVSARADRVTCAKCRAT